MLSNKLQKFYESSPMREGVLCWYPFRQDSSVLDLSGGILNEMLKASCTHVTTKPDNDGERFDYIVAIDPDDFGSGALTKLREKLTSNGRLLLAYENPFALRYWSNKRSSVTGMPSDPLFGKDGRVSKAEMQVRLKTAGFEGQKWYYPLTDHWFSREIYSENYLPDEYLNQRFRPYMSDDYTLMFDERGLYREAIRNGAFEFMCGAYLVEARSDAGDKPCEVDYAAVTSYREPPNRFATIIRNDGKVVKKPLHPDGIKTAKIAKNNHDELARLGLSVVPMELDGGSLVMPRLNLPTLWDYWVKKHSAGIFDAGEMFLQLDRIRNDIVRASSNGKCYWEMVPANCFFDESSNQIIYFDQEYCWENATADIAVARAIYSLKYSPALSSDPQSDTWLEQLKDRYALAERWDDLTALIRKIRADVFGDGTTLLDAETARASGTIAENRFYHVIKQLSRLGFRRPAIYGYGIRGKRLEKVMEDYIVNVAGVFDKSFNNEKPLETLLSESNADVVIVSILGGEDIAVMLREMTDIPVYTVEELLHEQR